MQSVENTHYKKNPDVLPDPNITFELLDLAVKENDPRIRFDLIVRACKTITDVLPMENKIAIFYEQRDFFFYLMALELFHPRIIREIMNAFLFKLKHYTGFIPIFFDSLVEIGRCAESTLENQEPTKEFDDFIQQYNVQPYRTGLSQAITSRMLDIKQIGLKYWEAFVAGRLQTIYTLYKPLDPLKIWVSFVIHTKNESIIKRACEIIEKIQSDKFGEQLLKDPNFGKEVAEANRKGMNYITRLLYPAQKFITTTRSPSRQNSPTKVKSQNMSPSMMSSEFSPDKRVYLVDGIMMSPESKLLKEEQDKYVALSFGPHQLTEEPENLSSDIEKKEVSIEMQEFQFRFEEWLINNEVLALDPNDDISQFFEYEENYELLFTMMLDPFQIECSDSFYNTYNEAAGIIEQNKEKYLGGFCNSIDLEGAPDMTKEKEKLQTRSSYLPIYRAFKYQQVLLDPLNFSQIKFFKPNFISEFYMRLHQEMRKSFPKVIMNLAIQLIEFFIKQDPDQSIVNILEYNVPFILLWNVDNKSVRDVLCRLVNLPENYYKFSMINIVKLSRYYRYTNFFMDYAKLILFRESAVDFRKCAINYKPSDLHKIYQLNQKLMLEMANQAKKSSKPSSRNELLAAEDKDKYENPLTIVEEKLGLKSDIDNIKQFLDRKNVISAQPVSIERPLSSSKRAKSVPRIHLGAIVDRPGLKVQNTERESAPHFDFHPNKPVRVYPSLLESFSKIEPIPPTEKEEQLRSTKGRNYYTSYSSRRSTEPADQRRSVSRGSENRPLSTERSIGRQSRPSTSAVNARATTKVTNISSFLMDSEAKKSQLPSLNRLPSASERDGKSRRLESRESQNFSSIGIGGVPNNSLMMQSISSISSLPSKASMTNFKPPKFPAFKQQEVAPDTIEGLAQQEQFKEVLIRQNEDRASQLAESLYNSITEYFEKMVPTKLMKAIGLKDLAYIKLIKGFEGSYGPLPFTLIFRSYLIKMLKLEGDPNSSGYICGKIINQLLSNLQNYPNFQSLRVAINEEFCKDIEYLSRIIAQSLQWKKTEKPKVYLQNYIVHESLGSSRLMLIKTLEYLVTNDETRNFKAVNDISEQCWQALVYWFVELKHQNMFQNSALKIFEVALKHGSEELVLLILLKANLLSPLLVAYRDVFQNGVLMKNFHIDNFTLALKKMVSFIQYVEEERKGLTRAITMLSQLQSWADLKREFLSKDPFKPKPFPKELISMALPVSVFYPKRTDESSSQPKIKVKKALEQITSSLENLAEAPPLSERITMSKIKNPLVKIVKLRDLSESKRRIKSSQEPPVPTEKEKSRPVLIKARPKSVMKPREGAQAETRAEAGKNSAKTSKKLFI